MVPGSVRHVSEEQIDATVAVQRKRAALAHNPARERNFWKKLYRNLYLHMQDVRCRTDKTLKRQNGSRPASNLHWHWIRLKRKAGNPCGSKRNPGAKKQC